MSDGRGWIGLIAILSAVLTIYCAYEYFGNGPSNTPQAETEKVGTNEEIGKSAAQAPLKSEGATIEPPLDSLLGPERPDFLRSKGFELTEYPTFNRWEREQDQADEPFTETEVLIAENGELIIDASVFNIHNQCAWKRGSAAKLTYENGALCGIDSVLKGPKYQRRLSLAQDIVFIGLQSYPKPKKPYSCEQHDSLSECRFIELATKTRLAMPDNWVSRKRWGFDLGRATIDDESLEFDQRRAIIIGIKQRRVEVDAKDAIKRVALSTSIYDVKFSDFENAETSEAVPLKTSTRNSSNHR